MTGELLIPTAMSQYPLSPKRRRGLVLGQGHEHFLASAMSFMSRGVPSPTQL